MTELTVEMLDRIEREVERVSPKDGKGLVLYTPINHVEARRLIAAARKGLELQHIAETSTGTPHQPEDSAKPLAADSMVNRLRNFTAICDLSPSAHHLMCEAASLIERQAAEIDKSTREIDHYHHKFMQAQAEIERLERTNKQRHETILRLQTIIEPQAAEIEFWKGTAEKQCEAQALTHEQLVEAQAEIERLRQDNEILMGNTNAAIEDYNDVLAEMERLKDKIGSIEFWAKDASRKPRDRLMDIESCCASIRLSEEQKG